MSKPPANVRWEFGDVTLWVAFRPDDKPFPVSVFRRNGETDFKIHTEQTMSEEENQLLLDFMQQRARDLMALWPEAFAAQLTWSANNLKKPRKRRKS